MRSPILEQLIDAIFKSGLAGIVILCVVVVLRELKPYLIKGNHLSEENQEKNLELAQRILDNQYKVCEIQMQQTKILDRMDTRQDIIGRDVLEMKGKIVNIFKD